MKTKRERFEKVAGNRVRVILSKLDQLSNCANKNNYEYTEEDVRKMFGAIRESVKNTEMKFKDQLNKNHKSKFEF